MPYIAEPAVAREPLWRVGWPQILFLAVLFVIGAFVFFH
jgi:hypothetical protein